MKTHLLTLVLGAGAGALYFEHALKPKPGEKEDVPRETRLLTGAATGTVLAGTVLLVLFAYGSPAR